MIYEVAGATYENRQPAIEKIGPGDVAALVTEWENEHDPNAIAVWCGGFHIGYLGRTQARVVSDRMKAEGVGAYRATVERIEERDSLLFPFVTTEYQPVEAGGAELDGYSPPPSRFDPSFEVQKPPAKALTPGDRRVVGWVILAVLIGLLILAALD